jgi:hypothetical protein
MNRRIALKLHPQAERVETKCLPSAALAVLHVDHPPASPAISEPNGAGPPIHVSEAPPLLGIVPPGLRHHRGLPASAFQLVSISTPLPAPVGRVQVDNAPLVNGKTYDKISALEVINDTHSAIGPGQFAVSVAGSAFKRPFPERTWHPGQVLAFFATTGVQGFHYHLAGPQQTIPPNIYFNVRYDPATFTTTLHNLINSSFGSGRFKLI